MERPLQQRPPVLDWPWWSLLVVWGVALALGALLWQRFTRPPAPMVSTAKARRVVPLWLVLVLFILLVAALWITLRWGATHPGAG